MSLHVKTLNEQLIVLFCVVYLYRAFPELWRETNVPNALSRDLARG